MSGVKGRSGGHNRKPTAIKALDGTLKPSRVNPNEPTSPALEKVPRCPGHLKGEARRAWRSVGQKLTDMGVLTEVDLHALEAYCVVFARWREAETHLEGDDALMTLGGGGDRFSPGPIALFEDRRGLLEADEGLDERVRDHALQPVPGKG